MLFFIYSLTTKAFIKKSIKFKITNTCSRTQQFAINKYVFQVLLESIMVFESKGTLFASVIMNVISIVCSICVSVHYSRGSSALEKLINKQNKYILAKMNYEIVTILNWYCFFINFSKQICLFVYLVSNVEQNYIRVIRFRKLSNLNLCCLKFFLMFMLTDAE